MNTMFTDIAAANRDESASEPQHVRKAQMAAHWQHDAPLFIATYARGMARARLAGDAVKVAWYIERIAEVKGIGI